MNNYLLISDAAKEVKVESHVLRYWEEELHLPIKRNELGHRYYTEEDVERFKQIKNMKERGLQLKAIKMILKDGKLDVVSKEPHMAIDIVDAGEKRKPVAIAEENREEKAKRLQWLLQQMIRETLRENNQELCQEMKESIIKELDYQFRAQEEREEERDRIQAERNDKYYQRMDELLRKKSRKSVEAVKKNEEAQKREEKKETEKLMEEMQGKGGKKKRHFIF